VTHDDLVEELYLLRTYGVGVSDAAFDLARRADLRLYAPLGRQEAAMQLIRESAYRAAGIRRSSRTLRQA